MHTATYSPEDNKLRLYPECRLAREDYDRMKAHGFKWAPKQELFVAPMWTPAREDLLIEFCGEIDDEDKSLVERAEERADRFEDYSDNRAKDADQARKSVAAIADNIPLGQPILVGHHSEKRARRDAAKIENGMRRTVKLWECSQYWKQRAAGALRAAKYKELPAVRARRIRTIEADKRKQERTIQRATSNLKTWEACKDIEGARLIYSRSDAGWLSTAKHPTLDQHIHAWDVLQPMEERDEYHRANYPLWTLDQVKEQAHKVYGRTIAHAQRWIAHFDNRLTYERAMLEEQGGTATDKTGPEKGGGCRCWCSPSGGWSYIQKVNRVSVSVLDNWRNGGNNFSRVVPFHDLKAVMSAGEVEAARSQGRIADTAPDSLGSVQGFILRSDAPPPPPPPKSPEPDKAKDFEAIRETLRAGVQVVSAPQLFPTPPELCERMADLAELTAGDKVLEPSAGTGNLVKAIRARGIFRGDCTAIEINPKLAELLQAHTGNVRCADFLECVDQRGFDKVLMNPPFVNGEDIKHIEHARGFLRPGGRLVALCANGPRQQDKLKPIATSWELLPAGTFKEQGTGVNVALLVIDAADTGKPILNALVDASESFADSTVEDITEGRTIWNSDGTDGPCLICAPPPKVTTEQIIDGWQNGVEPYNLTQGVLL